MSEYNKTILTNAGIDLARRANKGTATFQLTRGVSSTDNLSGKTVEELQNLTQLPSVQQSVILSDVVNTTDNPDTVLGIRMTFDNQNLKTGYNVHTVGIYAKEPGKNEILYGIATAKTPEYIPDFGEQTLFKFDFLMYLVIGRTDKVTVEVSPDDVYRKKDTYNRTEIDTKVSDAVSKLNNKDAEIIKNLNDYKQENKTYHQNLEQQINRNFDTKADKSNTYTKADVDNKISPKAEKTYVDTELNKKADKSTTYTKAEVDEISKHWKSEIHRDAVDLNTLRTTGHYILDSQGNLNTPPDWEDKRVILDVLTFDSNARIQIAYGIGTSGKKLAYRYWEGNTYQPWQVPAKSVNGYKADANGNIQLPQLKAKTLIDYDVKTKAATYDENARFDANGNFSRWPVDQLVIGQLADAINAKLPIEAGPNNADLLVNSGNKIVYWSGNGGGVKNLPPMNNKQWFFAIKLFDPGWGSVTVVDQDGTYWLNTKNGDVWTGWRSVITNEHLKKLKFVKQSLNQNGDAFQDTQFVTQEADGTFKINIYDSDWTANKVSWLLKNTKSYSIGNDTDLNNVKNTGFYNAAGTSGIKNSPVSAWFSMSVNANQWNGQQTLYDTNSGQFYVRTWNSTRFTDWQRIANAGDLTNQSITSITDYDVGAEGWHNTQVGKFSPSGNFANYLVDAGALKPIAHSINVLNSSALMRGGGEMAKGSTILWQGTNAGPNIQEGNIGGLQWNGATDYIKIYGDNTGSDNLDLAIQLGDDNSNHVSFRRADGAEVAAIWANGHYTGTTDWNNVINRPDINNANPSVTVINSFDVANVREGPHQTWPVKQPWLVDQMALHPFAEAINSLKGQGTYRINNAVDVNTLTGIPNQVTVYILTNGNNRGIPIALTNPSLSDARGTLIVFNYDGNAKTQIWMPVGTSGQMGFAWRYWEGQYAPAWHTYYDTITSLGSATDSLREDMTKFQQRVDPNTPKGSFNNQTVNINDLRETGIYRFANCHIQNGPYTNDYAHWIYLKVTVFDANTVYQTLYEGDNMYGRKSSSPSDWGRWRRYLNEVI